MKPLTDNEKDLLRKVLNDHINSLSKSKILQHLSGVSKQQADREIRTVESILGKL